jgi:hypothetical protein
MVLAGMIVWVPRGGGQMEIVGDEPQLSYTTEEEAADSIVRVTTSDAEQSRLRAYLRTRAALFGTQRFTDELSAIVAAFRE